MPRDESQQPQSVSHFAQLGQALEEFRPRLLAMLRRRIDPVLSARIDAEDVLQKAYLKARGGWPAFIAQENAAPYPWLYRIAYDCLIEEWRRGTRGPRDPRLEMPWPEHSSVQVGFGLVHPGTSPSQVVIREELRNSLKRVLELLSAKDREILRMRYEDELTYAEAAGVLGISENAAAVRCVRSLNRLRELWKRIHHESESPS